MDKPLKDIYKNSMTQMDQQILSNEEYREMTNEFYEILTENLSKKERDKVDILMGKILSLESEIAWTAGSKFTAKIIFELLK